MAREIGQRGRNRRLDVGRGRDVGVTGHAADHHVVALDLDAGEFLDAAEIDHVAGLRQALLQRRDEGHAARHDTAFGAWPLSRLIASASDFGR